MTVERVHHEFADPNGLPVVALSDIDLDLAPGSFTALVGPSGCGKSTLLRIIAGLTEPSGGAVRIGEREVRGPDHTCGVVFQQPALYPWLTVEENAALGLQFRKMKKAERLELARQQLQLVGLSDKAAARPYELSGGMQQRVQLARVLANAPSTILMDEPFGALDAITREHLQDELRSIWERAGKTILFVTHSVEEAVYLSTRIVVMSSRPGRIVLDVPVDLDERGPEARRSEDFVAIARTVADALSEHHDEQLGTS